MMVDRGGAWASIFGWASLGALTCAILSTSAHAAPVQVLATPITSFQSMSVGQRVGNLIWRGGLVLNAPDPFGGISGIRFLDGQSFVMVTDKGQFISGRIAEDDTGMITGLEAVEMMPIQNSHGDDLPRNYSRDAEAIDIVMREGQPAAVRVGFENLTRVADFDLVNNRPDGPAREVLIPEWLENERSNQTLEAVCIATPASPIAGSTLLITEGVTDEQGDHAGWLLGNLDKGPVSLSVSGGFSPTDCVFLPDGDLLVLERGTGFLSFTMQIRHIDAESVVPSARLEGDIILRASGGDIDNMEGLAIRQTSSGEIRLVIMSDDNFNDWERTLLLEFGLPEDMH